MADSNINGKVLAFEELTGVELEGMLEALSTALKVLQPRSA